MPKRIESPDSTVFAERNKEIGAILAAARARQHRTVTDCAAVMATTRRRYTAIERGEAAISAAELEAVMRFLQVSAGEMWSDLARESQARQVVIRALPGERLQLVVEVPQFERC
ncbi:MAG: hypothetical protein OHK0022_07160 [Roseiflexaceae bacterium]